MNSSIFKQRKIWKVDTTGASMKTAQQNNLTCSGEEASHTMAERDLEKIRDFKPIIKKVSSEKKVRADVTAGIISREQSWHLLEEAGEPLRQQMQVLVDRTKEVHKKFPEWKWKKQLKGGIAAYNAGVANVHDYDHVDEYTDHGDYSNDVVARAQYFKKKVFKS
ncbi:lysozyme g-like isoform X3 [Anabas testudineus]|uniref:lysozyme g-like isoform X3 n=1 Tax=Anabas testudineus TaxID=64144 RepID=UPI000E455420|nr:lysozyme g-like isoform X3 [Anabas testudineus]